MEGSGGSVLLTPFDCFQIEGTEISPNSFLLRQILDHFRKHDTWEVCQNKFCCQVPDYVYRVVEANTHGWNWKITPGGLKAELSELICAKSRSVESSIMIRWGFKDANSYVKLHEDHWKEKGFEFLQWESFGENVCVGGCNLGADEMSMFGNPSVDEKATSIAEHSEIHMKSTFKNFGFFLGTLILWWAFMALSFRTFPSGDACGTSTWFRRDRWVDTRSSGCHSSTPGGSKRVTQNHPK